MGEGVVTKPTNPKEIIGSDKTPMSLVPGSLKAYASLGFLEGMLKYGLVNWRHDGARASIYLDALERHVEKFKNGEWEDAETKVPHLASAVACLGIIIDAYECGKLIDDRPKQAPTAALIDKLGDTVKHLKALHAGKTPHHFTHESAATSFSVKLELPPVEPMPPDPRYGPPQLFAGPSRMGQMPMYENPLLVQDAYNDDTCIDPVCQSGYNADGLYYTCDRVVGHAGPHMEWEHYDHSDPNERASRQLRPGGLWND